MVAIAKYTKVLISSDDALQFPLELAFARASNWDVLHAARTETGAYLDSYTNSDRFEIESLSPRDKTPILRLEPSTQAMGKAVSLPWSYTSK